MDEMTCFRIVSLDSLKSNVESFRNAVSNEDVLKLVSNVSRKIDSSREMICDTGERLFNVYNQAQRLKEGRAKDPIFPFIVEILDELVQTSPELFYNEHYEAFLIDLSNKIESRRAELEAPLSGKLLLEETFNEECGLEKLQAYLNRIEAAIDYHDQLINQYGELISFLIRCLSDCGEYDRRRPLKNDMPLVKFVRSCVQIRETELAIQQIEESRKEQSESSVESDRLDGPVEKKAQEDVQDFVQNVESCPPEETPENSQDPILEENGLAEEPKNTDATESVESFETAVVAENPEPREQPKSSAVLEEGGSRADVLFVVDASGSMRPCFDQLIAHIKRFVEPFKESGFTSLRLGLLAYSANKNRSAQKIVYRNMFLCPDSANNMSVLYGDHDLASRKFFTNGASIEDNVNQFVRRLERIKCLGDEDTPFAMDCAADFPFEPLSATRRVVILFTDERIEEGVLQMKSVGENFETLEKIMEKFNQRHISLYFFGPHSPATEVVEDYPRVFFKDVVACQERRDDSETWDSLDISRVMDGLGKSISASALGATEEADFARATYGQDSWSEDSWG